MPGIWQWSISEHRKGDIRNQHGQLHRMRYYLNRLGNIKFFEFAVLPVSENNFRNFFSQFSKMLKRYSSQNLMLILNMYVSDRSFFGRKTCLIGTCPFLLQVWCFFLFFSPLNFDLNLQRNLVEMTVEFHISTCHLNSNWVNFLLKNCEIFFIFCKFWLANVVFFRFFLPFSLRFKCLIEFGWIYRWILHVQLSVHFEFSESSLEKLCNFLEILQIFTSKCRVFSYFSPF